MKYRTEHIFPKCMNEAECRYIAITFKNVILHLITLGMRVKRTSLNMTTAVKYAVQGNTL